MAFRPVLGTPQTALLLSHFRTKPSISPIEAAAMFRIRSLSRRINDLEAKGHVFSREQSKDTTGQRYVRYHYLGQQQPAAARRNPAPTQGQLGLRFAAR